MKKAPFELSLALRFLVPKKGKLSLSLISVLSLFVLSLVVWLLLLFLSVMGGMEKEWQERLTALHAPVRIYPTPAYYNSYYHMVDSFSSLSSYRLKTLGEKAGAKYIDPYRPDTDSELPRNFPKPEGRDFAKELYASILSCSKQFRELRFEEYEMGGALLRLDVKGGYLSQAFYVSTLPKNNPRFQSLLVAQSDAAIPRREGEGILVPKSMQESGVHVGDRGLLLYPTTTPTSTQEARLPVYVSGFYDPGLLPLGGRALLASKELVHRLSTTSSSAPFDRSLTNGLHLFYPEMEKVPLVKAALEKELQARGVAAYFRVESFQDYDFAKELLQQFESDRLLLFVVGILILLVGSGNIVSFLLLILHDKRREIGILMAMGTTPARIALLFATCGGAVGLMSVIVGSSAALLTLQNLDTVIGWVGALQGHPLFHTAFYGAHMPNAMSWSAFAFVAVMTPLLTMAAALLAAVKAMRISPAEILRAP